MVPAVIFSNKVRKQHESSNSVQYSGIDLETAVVKIDNASYLNGPIPNNATQGANVVSFDLIYSIVGGVVSTKNFGYTISTSDTKSTINQRQFIVGFQDGFDGVSPTIKKATYG